METNSLKSERIQGLLGAAQYLAPINGPSLGGFPDSASRTHPPTSGCSWAKVPGAPVWGGPGVSFPPRTWTTSSFRVFVHFLPFALVFHFLIVIGAGRRGGGERRAGKGPGGEGRRSAVAGCHAALPAPPPGRWERGGARGRGPGAWGRGRAAFSASRAAHRARRPPELGAEPGARSPQPVVVRLWDPGPAPAQQPGPRRAHPAMEPSHKDPETAAAASAVAAADPRGASSSSGVVVQVREKKGPLRAAIPYMPFPVAVICLFLNTFVPGLGTFVSAFTVLCGARTDLPDRHVCCVFWLNIAAALIQILTAIVMVGWIMSIFWGMDMVILASEWPQAPWDRGWGGGGARLGWAWEALVLG
uniref:Stum, mechanosensory transduction mediator homolog n=1 Tax=Oryctolagus cuniculus TaxID=9986 RepID=A0A5F9C7V4_RABIT